MKAISRCTPARTKTKRAQDSPRIGPIIGGLAGRSARLSRAAKPRSRVHSRPARNYPPAPALLAPAESRRGPLGPSGAAVPFHSVFRSPDLASVTPPTFALL